MIRLSFILAVFLCFTTSLAHAVGFQFIEVPADGLLTALKVGIWSPCTRPASEVKLGPVVMSVAKDCPISGDKLPLVVISHGRGGTIYPGRLFQGHARLKIPPLRSAALSDVELARDCSAMPWILLRFEAKLWARRRCRGAHAACVHRFTRIFSHRIDINRS